MRRSVKKAMAKIWFTSTNCPSLSAADLLIINQAARYLVDNSNMSPTRRWLMSVRTHYAPGLSVKDVINKVNEERLSIRDRTVRAYFEMV